MDSTSQPLRPSPDALLAETGGGHRGKLKVFLGPAPGVGKTYEMLSAARRKHADGIDVVVGVVETHGRTETEALLEGLTVLPRRPIEYRGRTFHELDLDALLARRPRLALIDELAHTNVPGMRHAKRYQDVEELLDAGIDVYTTLNVQHLDSYNDLIARITGVEVRETVPDRVLERAADVELIDLPPDDLLERLRQGKVYLPAQAERALSNFFSRGNLLVLRELAFRAAAERVDDDLSTFMRAHAIAGPWPARGGLLALIDTTESSEGLIRTARRLAEQRHVPWTVLFVQTVGTVLTDVQRAQLEANLALAEQLGGSSANIPGARVGTEVLEYARQRNVAQLLVGRPRGRRLRRLLRGSLADWLVDHAIGFEVTVASGEPDEERRQAPSSRSLPEWLRQLPKGRELGIGLALMAGAVALAAMLQPWLGSANLALIFLLAVALTGGFAGLGAALGASVLGFVLYNFLFTDPVRTLSVQRPEDVVTLVAFLVVSIVVGQLAGRLRQQAAESRRNTARVEALFDFSRRLATAVDERDLINAAARGFADVLAARALLLRGLPDGRIEVPAELERDGAFRETERAAAEWALAHREPAGQGTSTLPASGWYFMPVTAREHALAVVAVELKRSSPGPSAEERRLLFAMQAQLGTALERFRLHAVTTEARMQREAESLRSALLASVSHDLRTPLVSIIGGLTALQDLGQRLTGPDRAGLIDTALREAQRLDRFVQNLLDMTRLSYGALTPRLAPVGLADAVGSALRRLERMLRGRSVEVRLPADLPAARADAVLLEQVIVNLLDNAVKYSPPAEPVVIEAAADGDMLVVTITDRGPGITEEDRAHVFDPFYRARQRDATVSGTGLGLPICQGFLRAMGGRIEASSGPGGVGTTIRITLAQERQPAAMVSMT